MPIEGAGEISSTLDVVWDMGYGDDTKLYNMYIATSTLQSVIAI